MYLHLCNAEIIKYQIIVSRSSFTFSIAFQTLFFVDIVNLSSFYPSRYTLFIERSDASPVPILLHPQRDPVL